MGEIHGPDPAGSARGGFPVTRCHREFATKHADARK